jgi:hypothetical protein
MDEDGSAKASRRSLVTVLLSVIAVASVGALALSVYNTVTFDERVHDYVETHPQPLPRDVVTETRLGSVLSCSGKALVTWMNQEVIVSPDEKTGVLATYVGNTEPLLANC